MFGLIDSLPELGNPALFAAGTTVGDFEFQSAAAPPDFFTKFSAITDAGETFTGTVNLRVPDHGSTLVLSSCSLLGLMAARRRLMAA